MKKWKYFLVLAIGLFITLASTWYYQFFPFKKIPYLSIPVQFSETNIPYTQVEIGGMKCSLIIDLGAASECWLRKELLDKVSKQFLEKVWWIDIKGNTHETQEYKIPKIKVQTSWIKDIIIREETYISPLTDSSMWMIGEKLYKKNGDQVDGRIGWRFLTSFYPFFDFQNSVFYFTRGVDSLKKLEEKGYSLKDLSPALFEINFAGCIFIVDTDFGKKRFLLDTGCTYSIIKASIIDPENVITHTPEKRITNLHNISIGDYFVGEMEFHLFDFSKKFDDIDGIIGMDFFIKNIVYLDFKEKKALIGLSHPMDL